MTRDCHDIYWAAINAVDPVNAVENKLVHVDQSRFQVDGKKDIDLEDYEKVVLVAFGKASSAMATAVLNRLLLSSFLPEISGVVIVKDGHAKASEEELLNEHGVCIREASHPVPDQRSVDASNELLSLVRESASEKTLVVACISGGGSALFCAPAQGLTLDDLAITNQVLLKSGWGIHQMNVVRKRLDQGKGGRLAEAAYPGQVVSLILSDVLGDPLDLIASGPTVPDTSTWKDAWELVTRLPEGSLPDPVYSLLQEGQEGRAKDSPSSDHPVFANAFNCLVGNNGLAVSAAAKEAEKLGYHSIVLGTHVEGEAKDVARVFVAMAKHLQDGPGEFAISKLPAALIAGGETTVSIPSYSTGKGGRNQELALSAAYYMKSLGMRQVVLASVGTDGSDGPTDAAGAVVDGATVDRLLGDPRDALERHDAYYYLQQKDSSGKSPLIKVS